jgi:phosphonate transport system substrate-binding protein
MSASFKIYRYIRYFQLFCALLFLIVPGCNQKENPKKVSLYARSTDMPAKTEKIQKEPVYFGFDLRLGPKEDVKIYTPFLKYLDDATGKQFRLKFTEKYEDTVENLGSGATQFAAIGPLPLKRLI